MNINKLFILLAGIASTQLSPWANLAYAQESASRNNALEEIVVTAQKREQNLQDVPISITVATAEQLARQGVNEFTDLAYVSPALEMSDPGQSPGGGGVIRGLGTVAFSGTAEAAVGIVVDGVPQGLVPNLSLYDIERVEVLRGPQGTLFGQSASAGVINMVTVTPDPTETEFTVQGEYANKGSFGSKYGSEILRAIANIPLGDNAALRLSAISNVRTGVQRNVSNGQDAEYDKKGIRGRLYWAPSDTLDVNLTLDYNEQDVTGQEFFVQTEVPAGNTSFDFCGITPSPSNQLYCEEHPEFSSLENYGGSLSLAWDLNGYTLTSITGRRSQDNGRNSASIIRNEGGGFFIHDTNGPRERDFFTQELRISSPLGGKFDYVAGLFYSDYTSEQFSLPTDGSTLPPFAGGFDPTSNNDTSIENMAVFGQATYHVSEAFKLFGGLRYTEVDVFNASYNVATPADITAIGTTDDSWTGRIGGQYNFSDTTMAYLGLSTGYKGPQVNDAQRGTAAEIVKPEEPTSFEVGIKTTVLDGGLNLGFNAFYTEVKNYQDQVCRTVPVQQTLLCLPANVPEVVSQGFEIDFFGNPTDNLTLSGGLIYADTTYPNGYLNQEGEDIGGEQLAFAPKWRFLLTGEYHQSLSGSVEGFVSLDTVYETEKYLRTPQSISPGFLYDAHWLVGGAIGVRSSDGKWSVSLFGRNLTDENVPFVIFGDDESYMSITGNKTYRFVGLKFDARF